MKSIATLTALGLCLLSLQLSAADYIVRYFETPPVQTFSELGESEVLVDGLNIVSFKTFTPFEPDYVKDIFYDNPYVKWVQEDHPVSLREGLPNDPLWTSKWGLHNEDDTDINAPEAWRITRGGTDAAGNEIVVAVVDSGFDMSHQDLKDNLWVNRAETPGNGIDDDGNGYIDDAYGWDAYSDSGTVPGGRHGTHVAGIIGAKGNNALDVVGVNWNVKLMNIRGASNRTSIILKAYGYVLKQKQIWLNSGGKKGANVVVTNSSFGIDKAKCMSGEYPAWNEIYEEMGRHGILSAAATANRKWDVDKTGDVPTTCASPYIIAVTALQQEGKKRTQAAFGITSIDIAAPGDKIFSTLPGNKTKALSGTSMATPMVAGAVALLHSAASRSLNQQYLDRPGPTALKFKQMLLNSVTPTEELKTMVLSGGRLNLAGAIGQAHRFDE